MTRLYMRETLGGTAIRPTQSPEQFWYLMVLTGLISLGIGVVVLTDPGRSLKVLCVLVGIYLLVAGAVMIAKTVSTEDRGAGGILAGILALIAGVVVIRHPSQSVVAVSLALGIYFLVVGALDLAHAIIGPQRLLYLLRGVVLVGAGTIIVASPEISVKTLAILTGLALCVGGALQIAEGFVMRAQARGG